MNKIKPLLYFFVWLVLPQILFSQTGEDNYKFNRVDVGSGLSNSEVKCVYKDKTGFIWFGTKVGLCRFDGCEVKTYPLLSEDDIWSIEELDNDTLLLGTVSGLKYFSRKANSTVKLDIPSTIVKSIRKTAESQFLVGTEAGLYLVVP